MRFDFAISSLLGNCELVIPVCENSSSEQGEHASNGRATTLLQYLQTPVIGTSISLGPFELDKKPGPIPLIGVNPG